MSGNYQIDNNINVFTKPKWLKSCTYPNYVVFNYQTHHLLDDNRPLSLRPYIMRTPVSIVSDVFPSQVLPTSVPYVLKPVHPLLKILETLKVYLHLHTN